MVLEDMKNQSFPHFQLDDWKKKAVDSLKGKAIETFQATTYEGIKLKPFYSQEDETEVSQFPGGTDYRRGVDSLGYLVNHWKVAQRIAYQTPEELTEKLSLALKHGQSALSFEPSKGLFAADHFFEDLLRDGELYKKYPFALDAKEYHAEIIFGLEKALAQPEEQEKVTGYIGSDPLTIFVSQGTIPTNPDAFFTEWSETILQASRRFPMLRTILINTTPYHNGGANAIQELGVALASGVFYVQLLLDKGIGVEEAFAKTIFNFSVGAHFFTEIAKLRAARILWNKIGEVYGVNETCRGMQIAAETSFFTKTIYDPYVNILRGGNEAFAAALGGVQYLHIGAFDEITGSSEFSERISRNMQLILQAEAHLQTVADPAGGSWYVEALTRELAEKAWALFQEIEANGGILAALKSNWIQEKIAAVYEQRKLDIFTRKKRIVGTNMYANVNEAVPQDAKAETQHISYNQFDQVNIQSIPQVRLAADYENLRKRAAVLRQNSGVEPQVGLICLGSLKQHKPRLDFMRGFLSAGGIKTAVSDPVVSVENARKFLASSGARHICLCGSDDLYTTIGFEIVQCVKAEFPHCTVNLAGLPEKQEQSKWLEAGLKQFIHVKSNCYEILSSILTDMEVSIREQAQA